MGCVHIYKHIRCLKKFNNPLTHPSVFYHIVPLGVMGGWGLSQLSWEERQDTLNGTEHKPTTASHAAPADCFIIKLLQCNFNEPQKWYILEIMCYITYYIIVRLVKIKPNKSVAVEQFSTKVTCMNCQNSGYSSSASQQSPSSSHHPLLFDTL